MKFDEVYDGMTENLGALNLAMGMVYNNIENNPDDESQVALLQTLGDVGTKMINTQMEFVENYADKDMKETLQTRLEDKKIHLKQQVGEIVGSAMIKK